MKSIKEQIFKTIGYKFGIKNEIRLNKDKVGTMRMTPTQFLFTPLYGKKVYGALPKDLTKALLDTTKEKGFFNTKTEFSPDVDYVSKDRGALLMNVSCFHGTDYYIPFSNYTNIIIKIENEKMFFADFIRESYGKSNDHRYNIEKLTKEMIRYNEKKFQGDELFQFSDGCNLKFNK